MEYRKNVGIMLINNDGKVFMAKRNRANSGIVKSTKIWQMPQGGIDENETPEEAVMREMKEEIGTTNAKLIASSNTWYTYDFPKEVVSCNKKFKGQIQKWFIFLYQGKDEDFDFTTFEEQEFNDFAWTDADKIADMVIDFKAEVYKKVVEEFRPIISKYAKK